MSGLLERSRGRGAGDLRTVKIARNVMRYAEGSCMVEWGHTKVLCTATVEESVPPFLRNSGTGWVTGEYGMLPRSSGQRIARESIKGKVSGRTQEIQRLIGRSLRSVTDLAALGERTVIIDCDVVQADGGTRCASITGGFVALADALRNLRKDKGLPAVPLKDFIAAASVGMVKGHALLDLEYSEDSTAEVDMNVVMTGAKQFVEVQGTAEREPFSQADLNKMLRLAGAGIEKLFQLQKRALGITSLRSL